VVTGNGWLNWGNVGGDVVAKSGVEPTRDLLETRAVFPTALLWGGILDPAEIEEEGVVTQDQDGRIKKKKTPGEVSKTLRDLSKQQLPDPYEGQVTKLEGGGTIPWSVQLRAHNTLKKKQKYSRKHCGRDPLLFGRGRIDMTEGLPKWE